MNVAITHRDNVGIVLDLLENSNYMKSFVVTLVLCFVKFIPASCQIQETYWHWSVIDTVSIMCVYDHSHYYTFRSENLKEHEPFRLEIGNNISKYYSMKIFEADSLYYTTPQAKQEYQRRVLAGLKVKGDAKHSSLEKMRKIMPGGSHNEVYKYYPVQDSMLVHNGWSGRTMYTEAMEPQQWEILPDTMTILGYSCQRAYCKWRGRNYNAWFSEEIPISDGPYKFFGLPGLIIKVEDSSGEYIWHLQSIEKINDMRIYLSQPLNGQHYTKTDRIQELRNQWKGRLRIVKKFNSDAVMLGKQPTETEDPYDLIELDYK